MKSITLLLAVTCLALRVPGYAHSTSNAGGASAPDKSADKAEKPDLAARLEEMERKFQEQQAAHERQIAEMRKEHSEAIAAAGRSIEEVIKGREITPAEAPLEEGYDNSTLGLLAKGAGVPMKDVRWRVAAGLLPEQAVRAAAAQKEHDEKKARDEAEAKKAQAAKAAK